MRILVCGGRNYHDAATIFRVLSAFDSTSTVIHGDAPGADRLAGKSARRLGMKVEEYPAKWGEHGPSAGPIRNQVMLDSGINLVVAFPGGVGTSDMKRRAREAGVPVLEAT